VQYSNFPAESVSERIFEIGYDLTKLLPKVKGLGFLEHGVNLWDRDSQGHITVPCTKSDKSVSKAKECEIYAKTMKTQYA